MSWDLWCMPSLHVLLPMKKSSKPGAAWSAEACLILTWQHRVPLLTLLPASPNCTKHMHPIVNGASRRCASFCRRYDDSKALSAAKREELFAQMQGDASLVWSVDAISAQHISARMLAPCRTSLNELAMLSTIGLLHRLQERGMNITAVCLDPSTRSRRIYARTCIAAHNSTQ